MLLSTPGLGWSVRTIARGAGLQEGQASHQASHGHYRGHIDGSPRARHDSEHQFAPFGYLKKLTVGLHLKVVNITSGLPTVY
jgi:hypothetical protein